MCVKRAVFIWCLCARGTVCTHELVAMCVIVSESGIGHPGGQATEVSVLAWHRSLSWLLCCVSRAIYAMHAAPHQCQFRPVLACC